MTTKKRLEPTNRILLNAISRLVLRVDKLAEQAEHDADAIKLLVQARNDMTLRLGEVESQWRQHAKVSMERHQSTRALQTAVMDANERISKLDSRMYLGESALTGLKARVDAPTTETQRTDSQQWVLSFGNPNDGFDYVGPFATATEAIDYGEQWMPGQEWWTILLQAPAKE